MTQYIVALTGGIGSGKSTVANIFSALGVPLLDSDLIARKIVNPVSSALAAIVQRFGLEILHIDGSLNRSALRTHIFSKLEEKIWLNNLLHPLIKKETEKQLYYIRAPYILWVVPLLIENNLQQQANRVLVIDVDLDVQIVRTLIRDKISYKQLENILAAQVQRQHRLNYAHDVINNNYSFSNIVRKVIILHQQYLVLAALENSKNK